MLGFDNRQFTALLPEPKADVVRPLDIRPTGTRTVYPVYLYTKW